jgi:hypothetical protein
MGSTKEVSMFEREVMISTLRKSSLDLARLVEELEDRVGFDGLDLRYCQETVKRIENGLRRIRKIEAQIMPSSDRYGASFANCVW